jgi:hypothetical protein
MISNQFGQDLGEFAKQMRVEDFRLVAEPIALGHFEQQKARIAVHNTLTDEFETPNPTRMISTPVKERMAKPLPNQTTMRSFSWTRLALIHALDLFIVGVSIILALISSLFLVAQDQGRFELSTFILNPTVQKLLNLNMLQVLAGFYAVYGFYLVFFYFFANRTIAASLLTKKPL